MRSPPDHTTRWSYEAPASSIRYRWSDGCLRRWSNWFYHVRVYKNRLSPSFFLSFFYFIQQIDQAYVSRMERLVCQLVDVYFLPTRPATPFVSVLVHCRLRSLTYTLTTETALSISGESFLDGAKSEAYLMLLIQWSGGGDCSEAKTFFSASDQVNWWHT